MQATLHQAWAWWGALLLAGLLLEIVYLALWVVGYSITQAPEYSYEYVVQHPAILERFPRVYDVALQRWPQLISDAGWLVNALLALLGVAFLGYAVALLAARWAPPGPTLLAGGALAVVHQVTLLAMPGLFTTDLFSYATYGRLAAVYGLNPYIHMAASIPDDRIASWVHPLWQYAASVYGPLWIDLSLLITGVTRNASAVDQVFAYKLVANLAHVLNGGLLLALLRPTGLRAMALGLLLYAWNPLVAFEFAGNGHNDALMITFLLLGLLMLRHVHPGAAIACVTLGTLIKPTAVLVLPLFSVLWARRHVGLAGQLAALVGSGAVALAISALLYAPWYEGPETFGPIILWTTISPLYLNYVPDFLAQGIADRLVQRGTAPEAALEMAREGVKLATRVVFVLFTLWQMWRLRSQADLPAAAALSFLLFLVLVNTWVLAWYFTWPLAMVAALARWHAITAVSVGMTATSLGVIYYHHFWWDTMPEEWYAAYLAPFLLAGLLALRRPAATVSGDLVPVQVAVPHEPGPSFR